MYYVFQVTWRRRKPLERPADQVPEGAHTGQPPGAPTTWSDQGRGRGAWDRGQQAAGVGGGVG